MEKNIKLQEKSMSAAKYRDAFIMACEEIKMDDELMQLAEPLIKYLKEKYDPHCKIEISSDAVRVIRTERQEMIELQS